MEAFIDNPRRFPRAPLRLRVAVASPGDGFSAETEDVGPGGCLIVSPRPLVLGLQLRLAIDGQAPGERLAVLGHVAWAEVATRLRAGVAFQGRLPGAMSPDDWFKRLLAAQPGMTSRIARAPDRLPLDAPLYLLPPPRHIVDLAEEEADLLRLVDNGVTPRRLLQEARERGPAVTRALFSLFEKRALTLALGESCPAWQWREVLARFHGDGVLEDHLVEDVVLPERPPSPFDAVRGLPRGVGPPPPEKPPVLRREASIPPRATTPRPLPRAAEPARPPPARAPARPAPPVSLVPPALMAPPSPPAPPAPRGASSADAPPRPRSPEAQQCFETALQAAAAGNFHTAIGLLRRALQLSPRDQEIASLLAKLVIPNQRP